MTAQLLGADCGLQGLYAEPTLVWLKGEGSLMVTHLSSVCWQTLNNSTTPPHRAM